MPDRLSHPPSLRIFFSTELWERYGFYVVQTLLALYLAFYFAWEDARIYPLIGSFTALTYVSPALGGWIADQWLGQKRAILAGSLLLCISYLALGLFLSETGLLIALSGITVGTGLLKPNISSLLGNEYPQGAPNRESGFTIFYMGITTGIILGTTLPSYFSTHFGWSATFFSASLGALFAFLTFIFGIYRYRIADYYPNQYQPYKAIYASTVIFVIWLASFYILYDPWLADGVFLSIVVLSLGYLLSRIMQSSRMQARQTLVIGLLCLISVMYWAFYFQMFSSLTLLIKRVAQPTLLGISFPPPYYVAIQSIGMILFGLLLTRIKNHSDVVKRSISTGNKFFIAIVLITLAYALIAIICQLSSDETLLSPLYFIPPFLLISLSELLLSPVGLSAVAMLSKQEEVSTMMGIFFVSLGLGGFLSGKLATITALPDPNIAISALKSHYALSIGTLFYYLIGITLFCLLLNRLIKQLILSTTTLQRQESLL